MIVRVNRLVSILFLIGIATLSQLVLVAPVQALTQSFQWTGLTGFSAQGTLSYDDNLASEIITEKGIGRTKQLQSATISFYSPTNELLAQYQDVIDGESQKEYFELNFDTAKHKFVGNLDLGGETPGEIFLKGTIGNQLSLVKIKATGEEYIIDCDRAFSQ